MENYNHDRNSKEMNDQLLVSHWVMFAYIGFALSHFPYQVSNREWLNASEIYFVKYSASLRYMYLHMYLREVFTCERKIILNFRSRFLELSSLSFYIYYKVPFAQSHRFVRLYFTINAQYISKDKIKKKRIITQYIIYIKFSVNII